ncbi:hypothetical protein B4U78_016370, partial [Microbacterium esteraromaticum]
LKRFNLFFFKYFLWLLTKLLKDFFYSLIFSHFLHLSILFCFFFQHFFFLFSLGYLFLCFFN